MSPGRKPKSSRLNLPFSFVSPLVKACGHSEGMATTPGEADRLVAREPPLGLPVMYQTWLDLLFLHWKVPAEMVQSTLPPGLHVDTYGGDAYIGIIPFRVTGLRPPLLPAVPVLSDFFEVNVRTYVFDKNGRPGIWFYSLYANQPLAVAGARLSYKLPYRNASIAVHRDDTTRRVEYRIQSGKALGHFSYSLADRLTNAEPGTLEFFLIERYVLFSSKPGGRALFSARVNHRPYLLCSSEVRQTSGELLRENGYALGGRPPDHGIASPGVETRVYGLEKVKPAKAAD